MDYIPAVPAGTARVRFILRGRRPPSGRRGPSNPAAHQQSDLARSDDEGLTFEYVADISTLGPFINLAVEVIDNATWPGLPESSGQGLLIWGSGEYRQSSVSFAFQPLDQIEDPGSIRYFTGLEDGQPAWSNSESDAQPLFAESCVGELSVLWNPHLEKWLMTYN